MTDLNIGVLGTGIVARVDDRGAVTSGDLSLDWWVGADDRWHLPSEATAAIRHRTGVAPIVETAVRVPGGEVSHTAYGAAARSGGVSVVEIENRSPVPLTIALVVRIGRPAVVTVDGSSLCLDGRPVLVMSGPPRAWAAGDSTEEIVTGGLARTGPVEGQSGPVELALLFPVPHRTALRAVLGDVAGIDPRELPPADAIARGWDRQLERGLQVALPPPIGELVDAARADLLLLSRRAPVVVAALEDWGFDHEATMGWAGLGSRARRHARRRVTPPDPWSMVRAAASDADPAGFLGALRAALVRERSRAIDLLPGFPPEWLGQSLTVDALPLRGGSLSFAVRWHGARPALLWDAPPGLHLRTPVLDPEWSSGAAVGETLLAEPPAPLLPMGTQERSSGDPVDAPAQFS
jgi:hypothetical protein